MITEQELINITANIDALNAASISLALTLVFSGHAGDVKEIAQTINNSEAISQETLNEKIIFFQDELAADILDDVLKQLEQGRELIDQDGIAFIKSALTDKALSDSNALLQQLNNSAPSHLPPLTEKLSKEEFSQYLLLLLDDGPTADAIIKIKKWLASMDPKVKAKREQALKRAELAEKLIVEIDNNNLTEITRLKEQGLELSSANGNLETVPILHAIENSNSQTVKGMLSLINTKDIDYISYLINESSNYSQYETTRILLEYLNSIDNNDDTFHNLLLDKYKKGRIDYVKLYYSIKGDFDHKISNRENELLENAILANSSELIHLLISKGVDVNTKVYAKYDLEDDWVSKFPPFHLARLQNKWKAFNALVELGVNLNTGDRTRDGKVIGITYFGQLLDKMKAITSDEDLIIDKFVSGGAVLAIDDNDETKRLLRHYAKTAGQTYKQAVVKFGYDTSADEQLIVGLSTLDSKKRIEISSEAISNGAKILPSDSLLEKAPFIIAIEKTPPDQLKTLTYLIVESGVYTDKYGNKWLPLLNAAIEYNKCEAFTKLLEEAKEYEIEINSTSSIYMRLVKENKPCFLKAFINYHPYYAFPDDERDVDEDSLKRGIVVLIEAIKHGNKELLEIVINNTGYRNSYTKDGKSAYKLAEELGYTNLLPLLSEQ